MSTLYEREYLRTKELLVCSKLPKSGSELGHYRPCNKLEFGT
jgi:hypothetical protein